VASEGCWLAVALTVGVCADSPPPVLVLKNNEVEEVSLFFLAKKGKYNGFHWLISLPTKAAGAGHRLLRD